MADDWGSRRQEIQQRMMLRGCHMATSFLTQEPEGRESRLKAVLDSACPSSHCHGLQYDAQFQRKSGVAPYFADWEQNLHVGKSRPGSLIPCFLTHGFIVEHASARVMTMKERYAVHGWNTLLPRSSPFYSDVLDVMQRAGCGPSQAKLFIGNSMHIPSIMAVSLYALCNVSRRSWADLDAWRIARASSTSSWNLEVSASGGDDEACRRPAESTDHEGPEGSPAWKRAKSCIFED